MEAVKEANNETHILNIMANDIENKGQNITIEIDKQLVD